jgi:hypothetical protein
MYLMLSLAILGAVVPVVTAPSFLPVPLNAEAIRIRGIDATPFVCKIERRSVVPRVGAGSRLTPQDVVLALDRGPLHLRYGLVWETAKHRQLGASVAAWSGDDPVPGYLHISGRTAAFSGAGHESFVMLLPAGEHRTMRAQVDVAPNGSARFMPGSLALVPEAPGR